MHWWERLSQFVVDRWLDLVIALVFAVVVAVVLELLNFGSRLRAGLRYIKNKLAEVSVVRLRKRITALQAQRDRYLLYLSSDKALYLVHFQLVVIMLMLIALGAASSVLSEVFPQIPYHLIVLFSYGLAIAIGFAGVKLSNLDTREKVSQMVEKLNSEITDLESKLNTRLRREEV